MDPSPGFSVSARLRSFVFAFRGIGSLIASQHNAWIHALATVVVVAAGLGFGIDRLEWVSVALAIGLVWSAEALNTAIEAISDLVSPDHHPLIERAKDVAAGAVLIAALAAVAVGALVFGPRLATWLS